MNRRTALALAVSLGAVACTHKDRNRAAPSDVAGLAAIPSTARVVIGATPAKLAGSELIARAFDQLIAREPDLADRLKRLADACHIDWATQIDSVEVAMVTGVAQPLVVATGKLSEPDLAKCVQTTVGGGGGTMTIEQADGRALYHVVEGNRVMYFAFGAKDTIALSGSKDLVLLGLGSGQKALDNPDLKAQLDRADTKAPLWAAGLVDADLGARLLKLTRGKLTTPPKAFLVSLDPTDGLKADLGVVMANEDDAKTLESQVSGILALAALAAQRWDLGQVAAKLEATRQTDTLHLGLALDDAEVKEVLSKVDTAAQAPQDAGPAVPVDAGAPKD